LITLTKRSRAVRAAAVALSLALTTGVAGCSGDQWAEQQGTGQGGYVEGDVSYREFAPAERGEAVQFAGETSTGGTLASTELIGNVAVVNFWYAACPPCRAEAADLQRVSETYADRGVRFVGVNIYDQAATANSFHETYGITYPSILDVDDAAVRLAFSETVPPQAIPSTVVLDKQGRVAAYIRGVADPSVLSAMIDRVLSEEA